MKTEYTEELVPKESFERIKKSLLGKTNSCSYGVYKEYDMLIVKVEAIQNLACEVKIRIDFVWMINSRYYLNIAAIDVAAALGY